MSERGNKETLMSGCAGCGEAMDFDPDDPRPEFEFQCEHCQKVNIVIWGGVSRPTGIRKSNQIHAMPMLRRNRCE